MNGYWIAAGASIFQLCFLFYIYLVNKKYKNSLFVGFPFVFLFPVCMIAQLVVYFGLIFGVLTDLKIIQ
jgi:hypothetical protein